MLHTYVEMRLNRWAAWYHAGERPGPCRIESWWGPMILNRSVAQTGRVPVRVSFDPVEAELTDRCVRALPGELRLVVFEVYTRGGTMEQKARTLGCCRDTVYERVSRANVKLLGFFNDVEAGVALPVYDKQKKVLNNSDKVFKFSAMVA